MEVVRTAGFGWTPGWAIKTYRQRALVAARKEREVTLESIQARRRRLPETPAAQRRLLHAVLSQQSQFAGLTAQWRDLESIPDADLAGIVEQLDAL
jgi:hypothetical protein